MVALQQQNRAAGIGIDVFYLPQRHGRMQELLPAFMSSTAELALAAKLAATAAVAPLVLDPAALLFSLKEAMLKALSFRLDDFIDLRELELVAISTTARKTGYDGDAGSFSYAGQAVDGSVFATVTGDYLLTAAKVYR